MSDSAVITSATEDGGVTEVVIEGVSKHALRGFIEYLYCGSIKTYPKSDNNNTSSATNKLHFIEEVKAVAAKFNYQHVDLISNRKLSEQQFKKDMAGIINSAKYSDVILTTSKAPGQEDSDEPVAKIFAHKALLCTRSQFFRNMFNSGMIEGSKQEIPVESIHSESVLNAVVHFLYTDEVVGVTVNNAVEVYMAARALGLELLENKTRDILKKNLDADSVKAIQSLAELHNDTKLKNACAQYIEKNKINTN